MKKAITEFIGTFALVFIGCGTLGFVLGRIKVQGAPASHALDDRTPTSRRVAADRAIKY